MGWSVRGRKPLQLWRIAIKPIDLIYHSLRNAIIRSYESGEMDNSMGQMELSLSTLDEKYNPTLFHHGEIRDESVRLLTEIQTEVDSIMGKRVYSDMWE